MSPRSRPPARRRRYCHHTAVLGTRRTRCGSHAACTSHTASASPVLAVASNSIPTYLQKGLRERVNKKSLLRRRCQFCYRGSHPGRHHGSRNLCRLSSRDLCRGSCVERARTGRAALSDHHAHRPATLAPSAGRAVKCQWWRCVPMSARAPRASLGATSDSRSDDFLLVTSTPSAGSSSHQRGAGRWRR